VLFWAYTAYAVVSTFWYQRHVHVYTFVIIGDLLFLLAAVWITIEWRRDAKKA
jgi:membrane protein DedA with SNARE-associated domain